MNAREASPTIPRPNQVVMQQSSPGTDHQFNLDNLLNYVERCNIAATNQTPTAAAGSSRQLQNPQPEDPVPEPRPVDPAIAAANKAIIDAEGFKANFTATKGRVPNMAVNNIEIDNQFFVLGCHVDSALRKKIQMGEYVDLEKLLPKARNYKQATEHERLEILKKDGLGFIIPSVEKENKIYNVNKWEQAFRVYASIYATANPHRGHEIWQYVDRITSAAATFYWDNVQYYDFMFRHLMGEHPERSWAITCQELWSYAMKDHLPRKFGQHQTTPQQGKKFGKQNKVNYCWKFNKNKCKAGANCRFEHKCSYCGSAQHYYSNLSKESWKE